MSLFNLANDLEIGRSADLVARPLQEQCQVFCHVTAAQVDSSSGALDRETFVDGACMGASITDIEDDTGGEATSVETQHRGRVEEKLWYLEVLKENLRRLDSVSNRIVGRFCQKNRVFSRVDLEFIENMPPNGFHVLPILDDSVLHGVRQLQDASEFLLISQDS